MQSLFICYNMLQIVYEYSDNICRNFVILPEFAT